MPHGLAQCKAVTGETSPLVVSADSVRSGTSPKDLSGTRQEMKKMRHNAEDTTYREMHNGRIKNHDLPVIHGPGTQEDCRKPVTENHLQPQVQQTEQNALSGYFRSRIPAHDPVKGEAG